MGNDTLSPLTHMHLKTASLMPRKSHPLWLGDKEDKAYRRRAKRERKAIASYYRILRKHRKEGDVSVAHRYGFVTTYSEAKARISHLASGE